MKVWIVTIGRYDEDYTIIGVFSSKEKAWEEIERGRWWSGPQVEEWEMDEMDPKGVGGEI